jgi:hypothetical protein
MGGIDSPLYHAACGALPLLAAQELELIRSMGQEFHWAAEPWVSHSSLVLCEIWDTTALSLRLFDPRVQHLP